MTFAAALQVYLSMLDGIRELKHDTATVLGWVEAVEIRRRGKLVAVMSPPPTSSSCSS